MCMGEGEQCALLGRCFEEDGLTVMVKVQLSP
jgi:hypothetical protein